MDNIQLTPILLKSENKIENKEEELNKLYFDKLIINRDNLFSLEEKKYIEIDAEIEYEHSETMYSIKQINTIYLNVKVNDLIIDYIGDISDIIDHIINFDCKKCIKSIDYTCNNFNLINYSNIKIISDKIRREEKDKNERKIFINNQLLKINNKIKKLQDKQNQLKEKYDKIKQIQLILNGE